MNKKTSIGDRFCRLLIIELDKDLTKKYQKRYWKCLCDCGNIISVRQSHLYLGNIKSCKCLARELTGQRGGSRSKQLSWQNAARGVYGNGYNDGDLIFEEFLILTQQNCYYCNSMPNNKKIGPAYINPILKQEEKDRYFIYNGLDRIDSSLPHNKNNVVPCCYKCNRAKSNYTYDEFRSWISRIKKHLFTNNNINEIK